MKKSNADERLVESYTSKDPGLIARYLGVKKYKMKSMHKGFPSYKRALFCKAVTETIKEYDERVAFDISYGNIIAASYQYLEVGRGVNEELMCSGYRLVMKDDSIPLAINVDQDPWTGSLFLTISYSDKNSAEALEFFKSVHDYMNDNNFYKGEKIDINGKFLTLENIDFDDLVLPEIDKKAIKMGALEFFNKEEIYKKNKIPYKRGLIFTGSPGTGKTYSGKVLMNNCESTTFLWITADILTKSKYDPASKIVKSIFDMGRELAPAVLFIEDIDDFLEKEGAVDAIKTAMDGMDSISGIVTILCTNYPEKLPMALVDRPSRFDEILIFKLPDEQLRLKLLNKFSEPMNIENRDSILKELAEKTEGLTGAHIKELIVYSLLLSCDEGRDIITEDDLAKALIKVQDTKNIAINGLKDVDIKCLVKELEYVKKNKNSGRNENE